MAEQTATQEDITRENINNLKKVYTEGGQIGEATAVMAMKLAASDPQTALNLETYNTFFKDKGGMGQFIEFAEDRLQHPSLGRLPESFQKNSALMGILIEDWKENKGSDDALFNRLGAAMHNDSELEEVITKKYASNPEALVPYLKKYDANPSQSALDSMIGEIKGTASLSQTAEVTGPKEKAPEPATMLAETSTPVESAKPATSKAAEAYTQDEVKGLVQSDSFKTKITDIYPHLGPDIDAFQESLNDPRKLANLTEKLNNHPEFLKGLNSASDKMKPGSEAREMFVAGTESGVRQIMQNPELLDDKGFMAGFELKAAAPMMFGDMIEALDKLGLGDFGRKMMAFFQEFMGGEGGSMLADLFNKDGAQLAMGNSPGMVGNVLSAFGQDGAKTTQQTAFVDDHNNATHITYKTDGQQVAAIDSNSGMPVDPELPWRNNPNMPAFKPPAIGMNMDLTPPPPTGAA